MQVLPLPGEGSKTAGSLTHCYAGYPGPHRGVAFRADINTPGILLAGSTQECAPLHSKKVQKKKKKPASQSAKILREREREGESRRAGERETARERERESESKQGRRKGREGGREGRRARDRASKGGGKEGGREGEREGERDRDSHLHTQRITTFILTSAINKVTATFVAVLRAAPPRRILHIPEWRGPCRRAAQNLLLQVPGTEFPGVKHAPIAAWEI